MSILRKFKNRLTSEKTIREGSIEYTLEKTNQEPKFQWIATCVDKSTPIVDLVMKDEIQGYPVQMSQYCFSGCQNLVSISHIPSHTDIEKLSPSIFADSGLCEIPHQLETAPKHIFLETYNLHNYEDMIKNQPQISMSLEKLDELLQDLVNAKNLHQVLPSYNQFRETSFLYNFEQKTILSGAGDDGIWHVITPVESLSTHPDFVNTLWISQGKYDSFMKQFDQSQSKDIKITPLSQEEGNKKLQEVYDVVISSIEARIQKIKDKYIKRAQDFKEKCSKIQQDVILSSQKQNKHENIVKEQPSTNMSLKKLNELLQELINAKNLHQVLPSYTQFRETSFLYNFEEKTILSGAGNDGIWHVITPVESLSTHPDFVNTLWISQGKYDSFMKQFDQSQSKDIKITPLSQEEGNQKLQEVYDVVINSIETRIQKIENKNNKQGQEFKKTDKEQYTEEVR